MTSLEDLFTLVRYQPFTPGGPVLVYRSKASGAYFYAVTEAHVVPVYNLNIFSSHLPVPLRPIVQEIIELFSRRRKGTPMSTRTLGAHTSCTRKQLRYVLRRIRGRVLLKTTPEQYLLCGGRWRSIYVLHPSLHPTIDHNPCPLPTHNAPTALPHQLTDVDFVPRHIPGTTWTHRICGGPTWMAMICVVEAVDGVTYGDVTPFVDEVTRVLDNTRNPDVTAFAALARTRERHGYFVLAMVQKTDNTSCIVQCGDMVAQVDGHVVSDVHTVDNPEEVMRIGNGIRDAEDRGGKTVAGWTRFTRCVGCHYLHRFGMSSSASIIDIDACWNNITLSSGTAASGADLRISRDYWTKYCEGTGSAH